MDCVNLKECFGRKYKVRREESYYADRGPRAWADDPWLQIMPCLLGHIFPHGGDVLAASTDKAGPTARKLKGLPFATVHQDGDDGVTVLFHADRFGEVAAIMQPRRRRVASEAEKARLRQLSRLHGFQPITGARGAIAICVPMG